MGARVLVLATDAHGGFGGIALYNRDVLEALAQADRIDEIVVLARLAETAGFTAPEKVRYDLKALGSQGRFLLRSAYHALFGGPFDLVYCAHLNLLPVATAIARLRRVPLVLAIYGIDAWTAPKGRLLAWCARTCPHVVSISHITLDRFKAWAGSGARSYGVLPNAIRAEHYGRGEKNPELLERLGLRGRRVIMTLGRMSHDEQYKGFDEVLDLLPQLRRSAPGVAYLIVGDGSDRERLAAKARAAGVSDLVVFAGRISEHEKADYYRLADAYVMPSSGEGFGFVVLEALACGLPVVASSTDGTREAARDGELGLLVDPQDPAALEAAILEALSRPKAIPSGLDYFSFASFERRLNAAITPLLAA
ncbi:MAG: glycosyltransferase family 4 protein [Phenylobacterium sp.]